MLGEIIKKFKNIRFSITQKKFQHFGKGNDISVRTRFYYYERISLGSYIYIGPGAEINGLGGVVIKDGTIIGPNLFLHSANHHYRSAKSIPYDETFDFKKVVINENVWVGANVIIAPGAEIGEGCIIGAGAVVSGKIPPLSIVVGNPCKVIKERDAEHYFKLKREGEIYLKNKFENGVNPNINEGYETK